MEAVQIIVAVYTSLRIRIDIRRCLEVVSSALIEMLCTVEQVPVGDGSPTPWNFSLIPYQDFFAFVGDVANTKIYSTVMDWIQGHWKTTTLLKVDRP